MDRANVCVIQRGSGSSFALESFERHRVLRKRLRKEFQGHTSTEPQILSAIHDSHAAATEHFHDSVMADRHSCLHCAPSISGFKVERNFLGTVILDQCRRSFVHSVSDSTSRCSGLSLQQSHRAWFSCDHARWSRRHIPGITRIRQ